MYLDKGDKAEKQAFGQSLIIRELWVCSCPSQMLVVGGGLKGQKRQEMHHFLLLES